MDKADLQAIVTMLTYAVMAGFGLAIGAFTAGVAAGLAVQGFELVR